MNGKKKKGRPNYLTAAIPLFLAACGILPGDPPRTSSIEERAQAYSLVTTAETALNALYALGDLSLADFEAGQRTIVQLRDIIAVSETTPMQWGDVLQRALNLSIVWIVPRQGG